MGRIRNRALARAARLGAKDGERSKPDVAPLVCPSCGAPVPLAPGDVATCVNCQAKVPMPEAVRKLRDAEQQNTADRAEAEALYRKLGKPPSLLLRAWVTFTVLLAGAIGGVLALLFYLSSGLLFLALFALAFLAHALAYRLGVDLVDRYGGGVTCMGFAVVLIVIFVLPAWLFSYLDSAAELRRTLQINLAARLPKRPGFPATCRECGAALAVPPGAYGVRCAYCRADNLVALPPEWVAAAGAKQEHFHRSIGVAAEKAKALRAEARQNLPGGAIVCGCLVLAFGVIGHCSVWVDQDERIASYSDSMGPPRVLVGPEGRDDIPIDKVVDYALGGPYTVALRRGEVLELSTLVAWEPSVEVSNTTTFPFLSWAENVAFTPQTDGWNTARYTAPYTGLFELQFGGIEQFRWRTGVHARPGVLPAPATTTVPATEATPVAPEIADFARQQHAPLVAVVPRRPDLIVTSGKDDKPSVNIALWSRASGLQVKQLISNSPVAALALSSSGGNLVTLSDHLVVWRIPPEGPNDGARFADSIGTFAIKEQTAVVFLGPEVFAVGDAHGGIEVWNAVTGMLRYRLPAVPAAVSALAVSPDGRTLSVTYAGGTRGYAVAQPDAWSR